DMFAAMADASAPLDANQNPVFGTPKVAGNGLRLPIASPVSKYLFGTNKDGKDGNKVLQKRFNAPNVPIFVNNTTPFLGDYIDVAAQTIVATGNPAKPYAFNVGPGSAAFHVAWADNRDVVPPPKGS